MDRISISVISAIFLLMAFFSAGFAEETEGIPTLEVVGHATIMAKPNTAMLSFATETNGKNAQDAVQQNAAQTETLLKSLRGILAEGDKIKTSGYSVSPVYDKEKRIRVEGYRVINMVIVETKDLDRVGELIDGAAKAGVNRMGGLTFSHDGRDELQAEAAVEAVHRAVKTAEKLATAARLTIRRIIRISYSPRGPISPLREPRALAAPSARTPIEIGEIPIEANVTLVFEVN
jgi:uncharacterized protein YggE